MKKKFTKSTPVIIMFVAMFQSLYPQDYLITFSGSGQSTTVETVEVKNIDQQTTLTLSGTDTLHLTDVVGTGILPSLNQGMIIYPNPTNQSSRLEFHNSKVFNTRIEIYDFSGRLLIHKSIQLDAVSHAFTISGLNAGIYLVKVRTPEHIYSQRLVSTSVKLSSLELHYEGITQSRQQEPDLKSISNVVAMQYNEGERLVIKAISGDYSHIKSLIPTENQSIVFEFMDCIDEDGNYYGVATIGDQLWISENLRVSKYNNGDSIPTGLSDNSWFNTTDGAYAIYPHTLVEGINSPEEMVNAYGNLYNSFAVNDPRGLCPSGWHVPSCSELTMLENYVVSHGYPNDNHQNPNGTGCALKSCWQVDSPYGDYCDTFEHPRWDSDSTFNGFDAFGFSALPAGWRSLLGNYEQIGETISLWSSSANSFRKMYLSSGILHFGSSSLGNGFSVRCVRNVDLRGVND
jgi:uncharacterized protein (TIGR02145 family)